METRKADIAERPRLLEDWNDDVGDVLWWCFPIEEPPYVGSPMSDDWPGYHTHWTPIFLPRSPDKGDRITVSWWGARGSNPGPGD
jgi:hypothetical protein